MISSCKEAIIKKYIKKVRHKFNDILDAIDQALINEKNTSYQKTKQ